MRGFIFMTALLLHIVADLHPCPPIFLFYIENKRINLGHSSDALGAQIYEMINKGMAWIILACQIKLSFMYFYV